MAVRGGQKLEAALKAIAKKLSNAKSVKVGFLENQKYPDGTHVALVAAIQDYGAPAKNIPSRPFFRNMIAKESKGWPDTTAKLLKQTNFDARKALTLLGQHVAEQLQQSILDTNAPPLSPKTIKRKSGNLTPRQKANLKKLGIMGPEKPLVETGLLLRSPDYEVS